MARDWWKTVSDIVYNNEKNNQNATELLLKMYSFIFI